jgi:hypothetical protein
VSGDCHNKSFQQMFQHQNSEIAAAKTWCDAGPRVSSSKGASAASFAGVRLMARSANDFWTSGTKVQ